MTDSAGAWIVLDEMPEDNNKEEGFCVAIKSQGPKICGVTDKDDPIWVQPIRTPMERTMEVVDDGLQVIVQKKAIKGRVHQCPLCPDQFRHVKRHVMG